MLEFPASLPRGPGTAETSRRTSKQGKGAPRATGGRRLRNTAATTRGTRAPQEEKSFRKARGRTNA